MDQTRILVGRDRNCFIYLQSPEVSRHHLEILRDGENYFVIDLKSENKSFLNEVPLPPEEKTLLKSGDLLRAGPHEIRFLTTSSLEENDVYEVTDSNILEIKMAKKLLKALDRENHPSLEVMEGPLSGQKFVLEGKNQQVTIGRDVGCEFRIDSDVISRKHAKVTRKLDSVVVEDLGSRNGVYVGKEKVRKKELRDGDRIHFGTIILIFRNPLEAAKDLEPLPSEPQKPPPAPKSEEPPPPPPSPESSRSVTSLMKIKSWPISEILLSLLGLAVIVGALWGILKIL